MFVASKNICLRLGDGIWLISEERIRSILVDGLGLQN